MERRHIFFVQCPVAMSLPTTTASEENALPAHSGRRAMPPQNWALLDLHSHKLEVSPHFFQQVVKVPLVVRADGHAVGNPVNNVELRRRGSEEAEEWDTLTTNC